MTDIARLTGIQRPTIYRLLAALLDAGLVLPVTGTKKYRAQLAVDPDTRSRDPRVRQLLPVLRRLADRTGDAVFLVVRDEDDSISLHREIGSYPCRSSPPTPASASRWAWDRAAWRSWPPCPTRSRAASSSAIPAGSTSTAA